MILKYAAATRPDRRILAIACNVTVAIANFFPSALGEPFSQARLGWTVGAGIEYALTDNWLARIEYRHSDFGASTFDSTNFDGNSYRIRVKDNALRAGVAYRFNFADQPSPSH